ncbi:MAG TPA: hypothetical protein VIJ38_17295 [Acidobacteriaceae bacterium]
MAESLHGSCTLGGGQFCTKPGVELAQTAQAAGFVEWLRSAYQGLPETAFSDALKGMKLLKILRLRNGA